MLVFGILMLDLSVQGLHITNQSEIYSLRPDARSRITSAYMASFFAGGVFGLGALLICLRSFRMAGGLPCGNGFRNGCHDLMALNPPEKVSLCRASDHLRPSRTRRRTVVFRLLPVQCFTSTPLSV